MHWEQLRGIGQFLDIALANLHDAVECAAVESAAAEFDVTDAYTAATTEVQVLFAVPLSQARALVGQAIAASERLPRTAELLREGQLSPDAFAAVVDRTDIVDTVAAMTAVDDDLAAALAAAGHVSTKTAQRIADRTVARHDPDAVRRRRDRAQRRKNVTARDYGDGLGGLHLTADAEETQLSLAAVNALTDGVCPHDPRTRGQRRSAAATARLRGLAFTCACPDPATCTATLSPEQITQRQARIVVHAICQKSTLDGHDDEPGYLDGHGILSAEHARGLAQRPDATVRDLDLDQFGAPDEPPETPILIERTAQPADPYRPTTALDVLVRALFQTCSVPGCDRPAWNCELDHVDEYDHACPATGGPTCLCNLGPTCVLHHQIKTHAGTPDPAEGFLDPSSACRRRLRHPLRTGDQWIDQWIDDHGTVWTSITTPHGLTVDTPAPGQWMFPQLAGVRCLHQRPTTPPPAPPDPNPHHDPSRGGLHTATAHKHPWRRAERARLRHQRAHTADSDPPPF